jgi:hypothetical protein
MCTTERDKADSEQLALAKSPLQIVGYLGHRTAPHIVAGLDGDGRQFAGIGLNDHSGLNSLCRSMICECPLLARNGSSDQV